MGEILYYRSLKSQKTINPIIALERSIFQSIRYVEFNNTVFSGAGNGFTPFLIPPPLPLIMVGGVVFTSSSFISHRAIIEETIAFIFSFPNRSI